MFYINHFKGTPDLHVFTFRNGEVLFEHGAGFCRGAADIDKVVIGGQVDDFQLARDAQIAPLFHFGDQGMAGIGGAEYQPLFTLRVPGEDFFHLHDCDQVEA